MAGQEKPGLIARPGRGDHGVISTCLGLLVQELEASCDPALNTMIKIP